MPIDTIIFDLGGVLIDWSAEYVFDDNYFDSPETKDYFFKYICTHDWNEQQDAGHPLAQATAERIELFPEWENPIRDFYGRWPEMLKGQIEGTVEILRAIKDTKRYKLFALTNWSAETFPIALMRFDFLGWFDGRLVSGDEKMIKPQHDFYQLLMDRYQINKQNAIFIDDNYRNVEAAKAFGLHTIHFINPEQLTEDLSALNISPFGQ